LNGEILTRYVFPEIPQGLFSKLFIPVSISIPALKLQAVRNKPAFTGGIVFLFYI
jgi:hypothetical protein